MRFIGRLADRVGPEDFAILCATCHRLIHRLERPDDLEGLRRLARGQAGGAGYPIKRS